MKRILAPLIFVLLALTLAAFPAFAISEGTPAEAAEHLQNVAAGVRGLIHVLAGFCEKCAFRSGKSHSCTPVLTLKVALVDSISCKRIADEVVSFLTVMNGVV